MDKQGKKRYQWPRAQEMLLMEEVEKRDILRDPSTSNNANLKMAAWKDVTDIINLTLMSQNYLKVLKCISL